MTRALPAFQWDLTSYKQEDQQLWTDKLLALATMAPCLHTATVSCSDSRTELLLQRLLQLLKVGDPCPSYYGMHSYQQQQKLVRGLQFHKQTKEKYGL
jgi:hypothetical protein